MLSLPRQVTFMREEYQAASNRLFQELRSLHQTMKEIDQRGSRSILFFSPEYKQEWLFSVSFGSVLKKLQLYRQKSQT